MIVINKRKSLPLRTLQVWTLPLILCAAMLNVSAEQRKPDSSEAVVVVAHMAFAGKSSTDMAIQTKANGDRYLYVEHSPEQGISVVDITKPWEPELVGSTLWPDPATTHVADMAGEAVLLTEAEINSAAGQASTPRANAPLILWDTSSPNSPRVVQRFANVNRILSDDRGYVYVLNAEGLWVISTPTADRQGDPDALQNHVEYGGGG